ncbi:unnamed protein product [Blepharisma stoltei]|uniref:Receptor ligand binding region domain-containing protein n=1 Tax=Blepharisma stoltei TaxID=1481888 RepID=A0AAU9K1Q8_9CILI|nr:unnamed protein product [Blepharisma stoltei]
MALLEIIVFQLQILFYVSQAYNIDILVSAVTNPTLAEDLLASLNEKLQNNFMIILTKAEDCEIENGCLHLPSLVIDATFNTFYSFQVQTYSEAAHFLYINLRQPTGVYGKYELFSHIPYNFHYQALSLLVSFFNWETFIIVSNSAVNPIVLLFENEGKGSPVFCTDNETQDIYDLIIGREVKAKGIGNMIILNSGQGSSMIIKSLGSKMMLENGYGVILGSDSIWGNFSNDGLVFYTEEGLEKAESDSHFEYLALEKILDKILQVIDYTTEEIIQILEKQTISHHPEPSFSIINIQNGEKIKVGEVKNGKLLIENDMVYPGNSTSIPNMPKISITISLADGITDPGSADFTYLALIRQGNHYAFSVAYQSGLLRNFNLNIQSTDCGASVYDPTYSRPCFGRLKSNMGVVYLSSLYDNVCYGDILDFRALGISAPIISDGCAMPLFTNKAVFPEIMTVLKEMSYTAGLLPELANIFGWKNVVLIQRPEWAQSAYEIALTQLSSLHIGIANNQSYYFSTTYTIDQFEKYKDFFLDIINTKCRIVIALVDPITFGSLLISLYDLGMRKGDLIFLHHYRISVTDLVVGFETDIDKILELLQRSLTVHTAEWIGTYGETIKNQVEQIFHWSNFLGFAFDQTMLALNGIDYSISKGDNLENSSAVNANIRKQRFVGVTGTVSIESDSNSRSNFYINIFSVLPVSKISEKGDEKVGNYSISGTQRFLFNKITWPGEINTIPSDMRTNQIDCPFDYRLVQDSLDGKMIFLAIVSFLIVIEIFLGIFQKNRWRGVKIENLSDPKMMKFGDILIMAILWIETLELIAIGPDMRSYSIVISKSIRLVSSDWGGPLDITGDNFWIEIYAVISLISFMAYSACVLWKKMSKKHHHYFFELNELIAKIGILLLCSIAYIPLVSIVLSVFLCKERAGSSITDSFVSHDCYTYCWSGFHLAISLLCFTILIIYMTLVIYFQPSWQLFHPIFNIIINPKVAVYKSALYFIMIGVNRNVFLIDKALGGLIYSFMLLVLAFLYWKVRIYNYPRMNMWAIIAVFAVIWSNAVSSVYSIVNDGNNFFWEIALVAGWSILGFVGMLLQNFKFPNLLTTEKGIEMGVLFKFILGGKVLATDINELKMLPRVQGNASSNCNASYSEVQFFVAPDEHSKTKARFSASQLVLEA